VVRGDAVGAAPDRDHQDEPGDENNQDISSLVGKIDIRKLEHFAQNDPDAYSYSGGLCLANQGLLEFVEMFKAPIKMLHPLLTATQEGNFKGTRDFPPSRSTGSSSRTATSRSGTASATTATTRRSSTASTSSRCRTAARVGRGARSTKAPHQLVAAKAPCAPGTLDMMAQFSVLSRLKEPENSSIYSKMRVYDGETLKDVDPRRRRCRNTVTTPARTRA
jgi:serine protein kinase